MESDAERDALELVPGFAKLAEGFFAAEEALGGAGPKGDDGAWFDDIDFGFEEGNGGGHFLGGRFPVVDGLIFGGGTKFADVGNVDLVTGEAHGGKDLVKFDAGGADEGFAFLFVVVAGGFAHEHEVCFGISDGEDHGVAEAAEGFGWGPGVGDGGEGGDFFGRVVAGGADLGGCGCG